MDGYYVFDMHKDENNIFHINDVLLLYRLSIGVSKKQWKILIKNIVKHCIKYSVSVSVGLSKLRKEIVEYLSYYLRVLKI